MSMALAITLYNAQCTMGGGPGPNALCTMYVVTVHQTLAVWDWVSRTRSPPRTGTARAWPGHITGCGMQRCIQLYLGNPTRPSARHAAGSFPASSHSHHIGLPRHGAAAFISLHSMFLNLHCASGKLEAPEGLPNNDALAPRLP
jgi:hypothetical protein